MKILQQTPVLLVYQYRPILFWLGGGLFMMIGIMLIIVSTFPVYWLAPILIILGWGISRRYQALILTFDKTQNHLTTQWRGWLGGTESIQSLDNIVKVKLERVSSQVILELNSGERIMLCPSIFLGRKKKQTIVDKINDFISS